MTGDGWTRRRFLAGGALAAAFAGCLGDDGDDAEPPAEPIDLTEGQACDVCGMTIVDHYGPAGQLFYADGKPDDRDGPAWFDSVTELVAYHEGRRERGWELREGFVTDYSTVDYDLLERDDGGDSEGESETYISSHASREAFAEVTAVEYVVGSDVFGAMGEDHLPFSDSDEAAAFAEEHGGDVMSWEELPSPNA
ncbi:nitrous oxide reductase accessory protein NosL [Halobiforma lacisalsi AJ5]|uniref:Nitrous oxide reductase accessory protein NosL n=1 Tax=Natronobacterium lacisalsi AJ5 TaxID=358396 RepID=M0LHP6_NATLA|nr:nitrous oxide reductase accessory protein NosL [Halobiforma lacisalsi]APW96754.1 nitrous oxide reductase accessory protein NosL [Halobiforma lacisalsi AJ5]EMA31959.1 NosL family protein [Halobiforma lacisalsi AJ5]